MHAASSGFAFLALAFAGALAFWVGSGDDKSSTTSATGSSLVSPAP